MGAALDSVSVKKPHKFFEIYPDINIKNIELYLQGVYQQMCFDGKFGEYSIKNDKGMQIDISEEYNIFNYPNKEIYTLLKSIKEMTKNACEYYEINFNKQNYMIHGWFNLWKSLPATQIEEMSWHRHGEVGLPNFHGYYCVNAEPSITYYKINNTLFNNININNRAILYENSSPHAPGTWDNESDRITIAYDILPFDNAISSSIKSKWIKL